MISRYSVKKPFTVLVGVLLVIVLGVVSLGRMTTDLLPDMSFQYALIVTTDMGASPQEVESDVTAPLEAAMATTSNIKNVSSMSYNSYSLVTCEYEQNANMDSVVIEMQQKIDQVKAGWKDGVGTPTIMKINPDMLPIMMTAVDMDGKSKSEITDFVENTLKPAIESTEGVASVTATGELTEQIQVTMNQAKIDALNEKINNAVSKKFDDAKSQMDDASAKIESGQNAITSASDQMSAGVDTLKAQKAKLAEQKTQLESTLASLNEQKSQLETIQSALSDFMNSDTYTKTIPSLKEGANAPGEAGTALKAQLEQVNKQLATAAASLDSSKKELEKSKDDALDKSNLNAVLTIDSLSQLLVAQNFDMPAGYVNDSNGTQYIVQVGDEIKSIDDLTNLVLMDMKLDGIAPIHVGDVADVEMTDNSDETYAIVNGNPGIMLSMEKQTGYSTGDVTDRLLDKLDLLEKENDGLHTTVLMNQGVYIDMVVKSVMENMIVGAILAIFVLLLFLKDIKPTLVIAASIPLSVIVAVVLMYFTDITLNIISMSGLVLGIGMLVDNSIVVIENIYRLRGEGYSVKKAAVEGANQVAGAIFASTLTTVSVYAPIIFTDGITRQLFVDLALTVAFTLMASLVVALTFVPAIASGMLKKTKDIKHPWFDRFKDWYGNVLGTCLRFKPVVFIAAVVLLVGSGALCMSRGMTFMDMDMESNQISLTIEAKDDEKLDFKQLTELSDKVMDKISDIKGIDTIGATAGGSSTMNLMSSGSDSVSMYILLDEKSDVSSDKVIDEIEKRTKNLDCKVTASSQAMDSSEFFGSGLSVRIKGNDIDKLQKLAGDVADILKDTNGVTDIDDGLGDTINELKITVDKEKAAKYGYTVAQVYQLVSGEISSQKSATTITTDIKDYEVYLQSAEQSDVTVDDIKNLTFTYKDNDGSEKEIPLSDICTISQEQTLSTIHRDAQTRYITVSGAVDENHNVTLLSNKIKSKIDKLSIPDGYSIDMEGEDETINESMSQLGLMLVLAVIFIYLIMVAQFQSLLSPFIIMFCIPLAFTGGFIALFITGNELGIISMLGFIMLAGLIVNNGIVLIDYINQARREGMSKHEAIIDAGRTRLRPILMTAMTTILAMFTSAIGIGDGSDMIKPMAIAIIGGLVYGTILTLIVIPCIYDAFNREKSMVEEEL